MVRVEPRDTDRFGRTVALVVLPDGKVLNHELVRGGWAWWFARYAPGDEKLRKLEADARAVKRGLWADARPIPPWEWRKGTGLPAEAAGKVLAWIPIEP